MKSNTITIRCADGRTVYMQAERSSTAISCKNIIAGIMVGTSLMASAVIACACM